NETRFVENLENRKKSGGRNFVFIGSFKSNSEDIHPTSYGELHGPVILLNIVYSLVKGQHTLSLWLIFLLLAGYGLINTILVHRCLKIPILPKYVNDKLRRIEEKMSEKLSAIIN